MTGKSTSRDSDEDEEIDEHKNDTANSFEGLGVGMVHGLHDANGKLDVKLTSSSIKLLTGANHLSERMRQTTEASFLVTWFNK